MSEVSHEERSRLLLERVEREALRSAARDAGAGGAEAAVDALYVVELVRKMRKGEPLPPRELKKSEEE